MLLSKATEVEFLTSCFIGSNTKSEQNFQWNPNLCLFLIHPHVDEVYSRNTNGTWWWLLVAVSWCSQWKRILIWREGFSMISCILRQRLGAFSVWLVQGDQAVVRLRCLLASSSARVPATAFQKLLSCSVGHMNKAVVCSFRDIFVLPFPLSAVVHKKES